MPTVSPRAGVVVFAFVVAASASLSSCRGPSTSADATSGVAGAESPALEMFAGGQPRWPGELVGLDLGQPAAAWREHGFDDEGILTSQQFGHTRYLWQLDAERRVVRSVSIEFATEDAPLEALRERWGAPATRVDASGERVHLWFAPGRRLRAQLRRGFDEGTWRLDLGRYVPFEDFVGARAGLLAFEGDTSMIGMRADEVQARWPDDYHVPDGEDVTTGTLQLPPTRLDNFWSTVDPEFSLASDRVERYSVALTLDAAGHDALRDALTRVWGTSVEGQLDGADSARDEGVLQVFYAPTLQRRLRLHLIGAPEPAPRDAGLTVERYLPLEVLLAPRTRDRMVFEGERSWLGHMTEADFISRSAERREGDVRPDAWLRLPPIESDAGEVPVFGVFEDGVMIGYRLSLGTDLVPGFEREIIATFDRIYGSPIELPPATEGLAPDARVYQGEPSIVLEPGPGDEELTVRVGRQRP